MTLLYQVALQVYEPNKEVFAGRQETGAKLLRLEH